MGTYIIKGLSLCAGIGGFDLGLKLVLGGRYKTTCFVERDAYAQACLVARMEDSILDPALVWDNLTTFAGKRWRGKVDLISAGWPCQGFSTATRGRPRQENLWPYIERIICEIGPEVVFLENVPPAPWEMVKSQLGAFGYNTAFGVFCPSQLGAPHRRRRGFLVANTNCHSECRGTINEKMAVLPKDAGRVWKTNTRDLGVDDGVSSRMDKLRCLGNAVIPEVAASAFRELWGRTMNEVELPPIGENK